jgi:hypothetical protein
VCVAGCDEPAATWARAAIPGLDAIGGPLWLAVDSAERPTATVRCAELAPGTVGQYQLGGDTVYFDPAQVHSPDQVAAVVRHELVHWRVGRGPHPERARLHVCRLVNELPAGGCWPGRYGVALLNPSPSLDDWTASGAAPWTSEPTWMDSEFVLWALAP